VAVRKKSIHVEQLALGDVPWMSRDHIRAVLKKGGVACKNSKADMQAQMRELIEKAVASGDGTGMDPVADVEAIQMGELPVVRTEEVARAKQASSTSSSNRHSAAAKADAAAAKVDEAVKVEEAAVAGSAEAYVKVGGKRQREDGSGSRAGEGGRAEGGGDGDIRRSGRERDKERKANTGGVAPNSLAGVQRLLQEAGELGIGAACTELETLRDLLGRAYRWRVAAREALAEGHEASEAELDSLLDELSSLPLRLQERSLLEQKLACKRWLLSRREQLLTHLEGEPPPLHALEGLVGEATKLGLAELAEVKQAQTLISAARSWARRANAALRGGAAIDELRQLKELGSSLNVVLPEQAKVAQRIDDSAQWADRARLAVSSRRIHRSELLSLIESAKLSVVPPTLLGQVQAREALARWWLQRASAAFVKEGCNLPLIECLQGDGRYELTGPDGGWCSSLACGFCTGEDPSATSQFMIGCDKCEAWYHGPCVRVGKQAADSMDDYLCPHCAQATGVPYAFGPPLPLPKLTRRPKLRYASALLAEADEIGVETQEAELIRGIIARASHWQTKIEELLDRKRSEAPMAWAETARHLVDESGAFEVEPEGLQLLSLSLSRLEDWGNTAASLGVPVASTDPEIDLSGHNGAWDNVEDAASLSVQASWLSLPEADMRTLVHAVEHASKWRQMARQALVDGGSSAAESAAAGAMATSTTASLADLRALDEGRPLLQVLPEMEEIRLALARHELVGTL